MEHLLAASGIEVLLEGEWKQGSIFGHFDPALKLVTTPRIEERIARIWAESEREAREQNRLLFPGPLARILRYEPRGGELHFWLGATDYREFLGTRDLEDDALRADPLATCAAVRTSDRKILVGRRGGRNMDCPGWWHVIAGHADPTLDRCGNRIDVFHTILREIEEETGFSRDQTSAVCLGVVRWKTTHKPELVFAADTPLTFREMRPLDDEHDEIRGIDDDPRAIQEFLREAAGHTTGPGLACLVRYAAWRHGSAL